MFFLVAGSGTWGRGRGEGMMCRQGTQIVVVSLCLGRGSRGELVLGAVCRAVLWCLSASSGRPGCVKNRQNTDGCVEVNVARAFLSSALRVVGENTLGETGKNPIDNCFREVRECVSYLSAHFA